MKLLIVISSILILSGCSLMKPRTEVVIQPRIIPLEIPKTLTYPCDDYPLLKGGTGKEVMLWGKQVLHSAVDCKDRHDTLSKIVLDYTNDRDLVVILK